VCYAAGQDISKFECEPVALAIAGQLDVTSLTDVVGFPSDTKLNLFAGLGGKTAPAAIDAKGLQLAGMAGTQPGNASGVSVCVPPITFPPDTAAIPALNFDDLANQPPAAGSSTQVALDYQVGFALASQMLNRGFYDAFNSGMLCITVSDKTAAPISTSFLKILLPSIGLLTHGQDAPLAILLRPTTAPVIRIGRGTNNVNTDGTVTPNDPLITVTLNKLNLDFYATIDERSVRLFTLTADVSLPLGLRTFAGAQQDTLQPVLGDLTTVLTNITASNNEMLAEDPSELSQLLGAAIKLAQPLLAGVLKPITLPKMLGLDFQVKGVAGAVPIDPAHPENGYHHLAIWAGIQQCTGTPGGACARYETDTEAAIVNRNVPDDLEELRGPNRVLPSVDIEAKALTARHGDVDFSYRIDGGFWSPWIRQSRFTVQDELFMIQGHHRIEVTSREGGDDRTQDLEPAVVDFLVSIEPPTVALNELADGSIQTKSHSAASPSWALKYRYKFEGEGWSELGASRDISAAERGGRGVAVQVVDEAGRVAKAHIGDVSDELNAATQGAVGCSTMPGSTAWGLLPLMLVGVMLGLRRKRS
ncbi:MAG: hypothetical protein JST92_24700, partial [Deltaproteobacteria bacterium]|nr:hypothetical protein [Deltaproteobacteria bacterium]